MFKSKQIRKKPWEKKLFHERTTPKLGLKAIPFEINFGGFFNEDSDWSWEGAPYPTPIEVKEDVPKKKKEDLGWGF